MPHGYVVTNDGGLAPWAEPAIVSDVDDAAILNAGARSDADALNIATQHAQRPDRTVLADFHIADHHGGIVDESAGVNAGNMLPQRDGSS